MKNGIELVFFPQAPGILARIDPSAETNTVFGIKSGIVQPSIGEMIFPGKRN
jgi:hypothetical protein